MTAPPDGEPTHPLMGDPPDGGPPFIANYLRLLAVSPRTISDCSLYTHGFLKTLGAVHLPPLPVKIKAAVFRSPNSKNIILFYKM